MRVFIFSFIMLVVFYKYSVGPDMETEGKIMGALNEVKSFGKLAGGGIGLYDANGTLVLVLVKK